MGVACDKGFFKEEGLDVDLRPVQGIPDSQHHVQQGTLDSILRHNMLRSWDLRMDLRE